MESRSLGGNEKGEKGEEGEGGGGRRRRRRRGRGRRAGDRDFTLKIS